MPGKTFFETKVFSIDTGKEKVYFSFNRVVERASFIVPVQCLECVLFQSLEEKRIKK